MPDDNTTPEVTTPAGPPPEAAPTEDFFPTTERTEEPDVEALLRMDPFKLMEEATGKASAPEAGAGTDPAPVDAPPAGEEAIQAAPSSPAPDVGALQRELDALKAWKEGVQVGAAPTTPAPTEVEVPTPDFRYAVPDDLVAKFRSEDPREQAEAIGTFATNISRYTYQEAVKQVRREVSLVVPHMVEAIVQERDAKMEIRRDFYSTHKEFDKKELYPLVEQVARATAQELRETGWSPRLRDETARRLKVLLGSVAPAAARPAPAMVHPTARPAGPSTEFDFMDAIGLR